MRWMTHLRVALLSCCWVSGRRLWRRRDEELAHGGQGGFAQLIVGSTRTGERPGERERAEARLRLGTDSEGVRGRRGRLKPPTSSRCPLGQRRARRSSAAQRRRRSRAASARRTQSTGRSGAATAARSPAGQGASALSRRSSELEGHVRRGPKVERLAVRDAHRGDRREERHAPRARGARPVELLGRRYEPMQRSRRATELSGPIQSGRRRARRRLGRGVDGPHATPEARPGEDACRPAAVVRASRSTRSASAR